MRIFRRDKNSIFGRFLGAQKIQSFTLVELLIVIAILAILAAAVVIVINPGEMMAQARDAERISSIESLKKSIDLFVLDNPSASLGTSQTVYLSLPDASSSTCGSISGLPSLPSGWSYHCVTAANLRKTDSTGWVPLNFGNIYGGFPVSSLPIDPINSASEGKYYTYVMGGSYELTALMEAEKTSASISDGGSLPGVLEAGTDLSLTPPTRDKGLVGYWTFDEGSGTSIRDSSGKGNNGTTYNNPAWVTGKQSNALSFDGVDDYVSYGAPSSLDLTNSMTISAWVNPQDITAPYHHIVSKGESGSTVAMQYILIVMGDKPRFLISNGSSSNSVQGPAVSVGSWYHIVGALTSTQLKLWVNGVAITPVSRTINPASNGKKVIVGTNGAGGETFGGIIDDVRIYNRALSDAEVKVIYDATK